MKLFIYLTLALVVITIGLYNYQITSDTEIIEEVKGKYQEETIESVISKEKIEYIRKRERENEVRKSISDKRIAKLEEEISEIREKKNERYHAFIGY